MTNDSTTTNGNKRTVSIVLTISLSVFLSSGSALFATVYTSGKYAERIEETRRQLERMQDRDVIQDEKVSNLSLSDERLAGQLGNLNTQITNLRETIQSLQAELKEYRLSKN